MSTGHCACHALDGSALRAAARLLLRQSPTPTHSYGGGEGAREGAALGGPGGLTSPLGHERVHVHEGGQQLERDLEPGLFPGTEKE